MFSKLLNKIKSVSKVRLLLSVSVVFLSILLSITVTVAWISQNMKTTTNNLMFSLSSDLMDAFSETGRFLMVKDGQSEVIVGQPSRAFLPGTSQTFYIGMFNKSSATVTITSFGIEAPTVWYEGVKDSDNITVSYDNAATSKTVFNEIPVKETTDSETTYYYLGQQAQLAVTSYTIYNATLNGEGVMLGTAVKTVTTGYEAQPLLNETSVTDTGRIELVNVDSLIASGNTDASIVLAPKQAVLFEMNLTFEGLNEDQSMFIGFGQDDTSGRCKRVVYAIFSQTLTES